MLNNPNYILDLLPNVRQILIIIKCKGLCKVLFNDHQTSCEEWTLRGDFLKKSHV
jgi:hypothetical protein